MIVAIGKNNEIGKDNKLLWHLPNDLKFFKEITINKIVIMGRKTFESLPGKLPKRKQLIITNNKNYVCDAKVCHTIESVLEYITKTSEECFIIGGASIYQEFLPYAKYLYITKVDDIKASDAFFPKINEDDYHIILLGKNEDNGIKYKHYKYVRKNPRK